MPITVRYESLYPYTTRFLVVTHKADRRPTVVRELLEAGWEVVRPAKSDTETRLWWEGTGEYFAWTPSNRKEILDITNRILRANGFQNAPHTKVPKPQPLFP